ncbi:MAG: TonB-dependent receptor [Georgfuchsia sp.]
MYRSLLALAFAVMPLAASAAEETALPEVVVHVTGVRDSHASKILNTGDTAMLLSDLPGFSVYSAGGVSGLPALRGLADDRIKIRIDGAEITSACGNHMNAPLSYIDPTQVSYTKMLAGITPVSLGGDSIAGSIDIRSAQTVFAKTSTGKRTEGSLSVLGRSVDNSLTTSVSATVASDRLSLNYSGTQTEADSYKDGNGSKVLDTLYKSSNQTMTLGAQGEGNRWVLKVGEQTIPYQGFPNQAMDMVSNHAMLANLGYSGDFSWGVLDGKIYWQDTRHRMGFFTPEKPGTMPMETHGRDFGYTLMAELPLKDGNILRLGNELHHAELDDWWPPVAASAMMSPNTFVNINNGERERFVLFAEWEGRLDDRWTSLFGVRGESVRTDAGKVQGYGCMMCGMDTAAAATFNARSHDRRDNNTDLTALLKYEPAHTANYEFGYARKTRSPNLYERYSWGMGNMAMTMIGWFGDANGYVGNIDLKPEIAHTISVTADWHDAGNRAWNVNLTPYYSYVKDYIDADKTGSFVRYGRTLSLLQFANHDARLYGLSISWHAIAWDSAAYGVGDFKGKFDWTRGKRNDGGDLYHIMPPNLTLGLEQQLGNWINSAEVQLVAAKTAVDVRRNEDKTSGYALVNFGTRYQLSNDLSILAGVRNLFDRNYALPLGGVNIAAAKVVGATPLGPLFGQGRSIDLGMNMKF